MGPNKQEGVTKVRAQSIAEVVGDTRVRFFNCHYCKARTATNARGATRRICPKCCQEWAILRGRASNAVSQATKAGKIRPATNYDCADCGKQAVAYDHRDYSKPLEIEPVCGSCNWHRGPAKFSVPA